MKTSPQKAVVGYLEWHADEAEHDAGFLEECAHGFDAIKEPFLGVAKVCRGRANNIRASLESLRGIRPT
jgi:hypothetical protein